MYNCRKIFVPSFISFSVLKNSHMVYNNSLKKIGYRQITTQFKSEFNHVNNIFHNFKKQWFLKLTSIGVLGVIASYKSVRAHCQQASMEDIEETQVHLKLIQLKESSNLTHTTLLRAAGRVCTDGALQLMHRSTVACLDTSEQYRQSLHKVMELLEYCINIVRDKEQHDGLWEHVIAARNEMEAIKQQLMDLNILFDYSCLTLENAAMAAYISGAEFSASVSQQLITSAKQELDRERSKNTTLENQYTNIVAEHVRALAGHQTQEENNELECKSQEHDSYKSNQPQGQGDDRSNQPQSQGEDNSDILLNKYVKSPEANEEHTMIEGFSKENLGVNEEDKKKTDNQNNSEEIMNKNMENNWMSGFSEYVEYKEREDEKVLSF